MSSLQRFFFRLTHSTPERKASRAHLRQAKAGDAGAYLALSANYLDLALVYFGGCLHEPVERRFARVEQVFSALWQHLPYAERVSDFEYMLARALLGNAPENGPVASSEALVTQLRLLAPESRFALIAYEFENWPFRWVALLMRVRPRAMHRLLSEARCELCGLSWESLTKEERDCLEAVSLSLDSSPNLRVNKELSLRISNFPRVSEIKALWLELRPELVEVRQRYLPEASDRERLMGNILKGAQTASMHKPPFMDRVVNTVHFARHAKIKVS